MSDIMETPADFSKRSGVPEKLIRSYARQGKLPHIVTGTCHIRIHVEGALRALQLMAEETAASKASRMPVQLPRTFIPPMPNGTRKKQGRPLNAIRLKGK